MSVRESQSLKLANHLYSGLNNCNTDAERIAFIEGIFAPKEIPDTNHRFDARKLLVQQLNSDMAVSFRAVAAECGCSIETVGRVWRAVINQYPRIQPPDDNFIVIMPKEGRAKLMVESILGESGFRLDEDVKAIVDIQDGLPPIAYKEKRQREILPSLKVGVGHVAIIGSDKVFEVQAEARLNGQTPIEVDVHKQFLVDAFRMCIAVARERNGDLIHTFKDLQGKRIATTYPATLKEFLAARNITARIEKVDGGVEETVKERGMDAIMDIVETGGSLRKNDLIQLGAPLYPGDIRVVTMPGDRSTMLDDFTGRLQYGESVLKAA